MLRLGGSQFWLSLSAAGALALSGCASQVQATTAEASPDKPVTSPSEAVSVMPDQDDLIFTQERLDPLLLTHRDIYAGGEWSQETRTLTVLLAGPIDDPATPAGQLASEITSMRLPANVEVVKVPFSERDFELATAPLLEAMHSESRGLPEAGYIARDVRQGNLLIGVLKEDLPRWEEFTQQFESPIPIRLFGEDSIGITSQPGFVAISPDAQ